MEREMSAIPRVVIIGAGITGLSAAHYLKAAASEQGITLDLRLIEGADRVGGKIRTDRVGPYVFEAGPDAFLTQKPWATELARELGLGDDLIPINVVQPATSLLVRGKPRPLPRGLALIVPTQWGPFLRSPILSPLAKARMLSDLVRPPRGVKEDESLAAFVRARMGTAALDRLAEPLLIGIYSGSAETQSILATFPQYRAAEERAGSVLRGVLRQRAQHPASTAPPFLTLRRGVAQLPEALGQELREHLVLGQHVAGITTTSNGYDIRMADGTTLAADMVLVTTPARATARLFAESQPALAARLRDLRTVSTGTLSLVFDAHDISRPFAGYGLVIPPSEGRLINAITVTSGKFPHRAPSGKVLLRVFFGGARHADVVTWDDARIMKLVRYELRDLLGITAPPRIARLWRWRAASPQYDVGHIERVDGIMRLCPPNLWLAGCAYHGVGIPDCVRQGREAAAQIAQNLLTIKMTDRTTKNSLG
jgi:oxygen-dependent protoporphyrinogen oxidase